MQKIISAEQTKLADQYAIDNEPIASIDLMERASNAFVEAFRSKFNSNNNIQVVCGIGNNGGDGLAIARILKSKGYEVSATLVKFSDNLSSDCKLNLERLEGDVKVIGPESLEIGSEKIIIDALFGLGLNRPVKGELAGVIEKINASKSTVVSVDVPSGLFADEANLQGAIVEADLTITFQRPKLTFLIPETGKYVGEWQAVDIGLNEGFINDQQSDYYLISEEIKKRLPKRTKFLHKGNFGRVQVLAGSFGKMGAAFLCSKAVLRSGSGLVTAHVPKCGMTILQSSLPEVMLTIDQSEHHISNARLMENTDVVCIGPGLGKNSETVRNFKSILEQKPSKMVVDADGINILSEQKDWLDLLPEGAVLTPHLGEFHRLFGEFGNGLDRIKAALNVSVKRKLVIVIKGAHSAVVCPDGKVYFNTTGNSGMATAGSGDVLAGVITGLLAQGLSAIDASLMGVYIHGMTGDMAAKTFGKVSLMASDLLNILHQIIRND